MSSFLLQNECEDLLQELAKYHGISLFELISCDIKPYGEKQAGFLGDHFRLFLKCSLNGRIQDVTFFVKKIPQLEIHSNYIEDIGAFKKEVSLFQNLMPSLQDLTSFLEYQWAPKCFLSKPSLLIFEDLSVKGYRLVGEKNLFDLEHCIAVVKAIANMHAASIIWEQTENAKINEKFPEIGKEATYVQEHGHPRQKWLFSGCDALGYLCKKIGREEDSNKLIAVVKESVKLVEINPNSLNVLSHGDLWADNLMFLYNNEHKVENCVLVDFQLIRYSSCAIDLMCCIYLITCKTLREKHIIGLIETYYQQLSKVLEKAKINVKHLLNLEQLIEDCYKYKKLALSEACLFGLWIWIPSDLISSIFESSSKIFTMIFGDRSALIEKAFLKDSFFKTQMTTLINELLDNC